LTTDQNSHDVRTLTGDQAERVDDIFVGLQANALPQVPFRRVDEIGIANDFDIVSNAETPAQKPGPAGGAGARWYTVVAQAQTLHRDARSAIMFQDATAGRDPGVAGSGAREFHGAPEAVFKVKWAGHLEEARRRVTVAKRYAQKNRGAEEVSMNEIGP